MAKTAAQLKFERRKMKMIDPLAIDIAFGTITRGSLADLREPTRIIIKAVG